MYINTGIHLHNALIYIYIYILYKFVYLLRYAIVFSYCKVFLVYFVSDEGKNSSIPYKHTQLHCNQKQTYNTSPKQNSEREMYMTTLSVNSISSKAKLVLLQHTQTDMNRCGIKPLSFVFEGKDKLT